MADRFRILEKERERKKRMIRFLFFFLAMICLISEGMWSARMYGFQTHIFSGAEEMYMPRLAYLNRSPQKTVHEFFIEQSYLFLPTAGYAMEHRREEFTAEDQETAQNVQPSGETSLSSVDMSIERLRDFDYLLSNFYTVDSSTMIGPEQLNADDLLGRSMKINKKEDGPKVLIFHTHSQEEFVDSIPGDPATSIVGIGEYLTELLNKRGIKTIHDTGVYDIINGQLDRSNAYENAEASVRPILEANPTIEVAIDLHRDGVAEGTHLVTEINGKPTAKIMYFNGLSRSRTNGDIDYLYNPYIQDNLAFSLQMQLASERMYPGFARHIYLRAYRYNLHLLPKSLLIEAGAQTNTVEEMKNAMEVVADTLCEVILE